ncbi:MAG: cysteine desulfurase [Gammaproteobacteria bacterium]|nr:MAG: cysteine desulfurase [Gammaproteobacteria bacterium]
MSSPLTATPPPAADLPARRNDFPILQRQVHGRRLVYLDNAATTQKPQTVIEALDRYYREYNANIHRGVHTLSEEATEAYEGARATVARFINASSEREIVFVRGTTEAINLVAQSFGRPRLAAGDEILITHLEHHSNIVPWQLLCEQTGAVLKVAPINERGEVEIGALERLLSPRTKLLSVAHVSNALGTINPVAEITALARRHGVPVLLDGAQAVAHLPVDVQALDCDFYAFSGHKIFGPTGIGVLWAREALLEEMPPWQGGGDMIRTVSFDQTEYNHVPHKFEAGTPHIAGAIGLAAAIDYVQGIGLEAIGAYEHGLLEHATARMQELEGVRLIGTARHKAAVLSFTVEGAHPNDIGLLLDQHGVAVRSGHHCAMPVMEFFGVSGTARASMALYNTREDVDIFVDSLAKVLELLR